MEIKYRKLKKGKYKYELIESYECHTPIRGYIGCTKDNFVGILADGTIRFKIKYAWDGSTLSPDLKSNFRAALVHDGFFQLLREGIIPQSGLPSVDKLYRTMCLEDGMNKFLAQCFYIGLRTPIAHHFAKPRKK